MKNSINPAYTLHKFKALERRRVEFIGYLPKHNEFDSNVIEGKVLGKRGRESPRKPPLS